MKSGAHWVRRNNRNANRILCIFLLNLHELIMLLHIIITEYVFVSVDDVMKAHEISANSHCLFAKRGPVVFYCGPLRAFRTFCVPFKPLHLLHLSVFLWLIS